ncbi:MAG: hypothetical protein PHQ93_02725 [Sulfurimonas sp.]|uniref:hypothetical protein n=1 Tax=Sulfurimonas sp. TaxID=2022749 RepID=UPI002636E3EE|nr:hypothetical protein [Sulfurimonas sp.]MDD5400086.1 hypothetical protein [Sulfurimonas sp.]
MLRYMIVVVFLIGLLSPLMAKDTDTKLGCVGIDKLKSSVTPVDLAVGVMECIKNDKYREGVEMYMLFGAYGQFDTRRVIDTSAHQAIPALKMYISNTVTEAKREKWLQAVDTVVDDKNIGKLCTKIKQIGMPSYYPEYMIAHGLQAFNGGGKSGVYADFHAKETWEGILEGYVRCK